MQARWYQDAAITAFFDFISSNETGNPLIALPTGTGKGYVIAEMLRRSFLEYPDLRVIMATHVETLVQQNYEKFLQIWPLAPVGIYCAGLNKKEYINPIVFGTINSIAKNPALFGKRNLFLIDEAHLLSPNEDSMYQKTIQALLKINPSMRVGGLTATAYRLKQGGLTNGGLFTDVCYDMTDFNGFNRLLADGFLAPLISRPMQNKFDLDDVDKSGGEFVQGQLQKAVDKNELIIPMIKETLKYANGRNSWICFATGVDHTEHVADLFQSFGIPVLAYHSKLAKHEAKQRMQSFRQGDVAGLVSANMLTTGIDHAPLDLIIDFQPTLSPAKHVQKYGRGTRPYNYLTTHDAALAENFPYVKRNCLVLDFARNTMSNGPINDPRLPEPPGKKKTAGTMPIKICVDRSVNCEKIIGCGCYNHASVRTCDNCGEPFDFGTKLARESYAGEVMKTGVTLIKSEQPVIAEFNVDTVFYSRHEKRDRKTGVLLTAPSLKVIYVCGLKQFQEFVFFESDKPLPKHKAHEWWRQRHHGTPPVTVQQALEYVKGYRIPKKIKVEMSGDHPQVKDYVY